MTKIKNTKKGMAKKTLSMSLVVAMLATSNVPVWAAEFSDGTDANTVAEAFTAEAEAPVVEENTEAVAAQATETGAGYKVTATDFTNVSDGSAVWGNKVSSNITVTAKEGTDTTGVTYHCVWKENGVQVGGILDLTAGTPGEAYKDLVAADTGKSYSLYVYAKKGDSIVWSWTSDAFTVKPKDIKGIITTAPTLKSTFDLTYTGEAIVPTVDDFDFASLPTGFSKDDFTIGSTDGDTVNVTEKGVDVYLTVNKTGYAGSLIVNYKIKPLKLTNTNISDYLEATYLKTSVPYTGDTIHIKDTEMKIVDKKTGKDLSAYIKDKNAVSIGADKVGNPTGWKNEVQAGKEYTLTVPVKISKDDFENYYTETYSVIAPSNSVKIVERDLSTVDVSIPEQPYNNGAIVTVDSDDATYTDKTTGEELDLADDVVITSTATTQGTHDVTVSPKTNNTNVTGSTTAKLSIAASSLKNAAFSNNTYATAAEEYTGEQITKDITKLGKVTVNGITLIKDEDYKIEFGENVNAGTGTIKIVGLKSYVGSTKTIEFTINPAKVTAKTVSVSKFVEIKDTTKAADYKDAMALVVKAKNANGKEFVLTEGTDYVVDKYEFSTNGNKAGETVSVTLKTTTAGELKNTNFVVDGTAKYSSTITKAALKSENIKLKKTSYTYTGAAIEPEFDVVVDGRVINPSQYKIKSLTNNVNAGTATMVITGTDDTYSDAINASVTFTIEAADAANLTATVPSQVYTGYAIMPAVNTVTLNDIAINVKDNFTVTYGENVEIGEGTITLTPKNANFTGTKVITFKIAGQMLSGGSLKYYDENGLAVTPSHTYDGTAYAPAKTVFTYSKKLTEGTDYEIKYVDNVYGKNVSGTQKGIVLVVAKGKYAGNYTGDTVTDGIYTDAEGNKIENVIYAKQFDITTLTIKDTNVSVANGVYAGGLPVKPVVVVNVAGKTLVEGTDYELEYGTNDDRTKVTATNSLTVKIVGKNGYKTETSGISKNWGIDKFNLENAVVTVEGDTVTVKCGRVDIETSEYTVEKKDGKVTVTANRDSKNYTGSKTVDVETQDQKPGAPMISSVNVVGNKATVILSDESDGAMGYDYVISKDRDCITNKAYDAVNKNQIKTETTFNYVGQGTYYAYCHAWTRDENGKKVFSDWSNAYPFVVSAITPSQPTVTSVSVNGSTVTVTYTESENATGYDVVLGTSSKKVNGEVRPVGYTDKLVKKNQKQTTVTFENVEKGTYYVGLHAYNRTNPVNTDKVFSQWSNVKKVTVK